MGAREDILTGEVLDEGREYDTDRDVVIEMVSQGVLDPRGGRSQEWRFTGVAVRRAQIAARLQRELDVNMAGAALALDLLDELETLRRRLRRLE